jgi:hypothetical protein
MSREGDGDLLFPRKYAPAVAIAMIVIAVTLGLMMRHGNSSHAPSQAQVTVSATP